ncbi:hypothetical protein LCI18_002042 [Fusarium solani-melongenae]|uniref:Uncharacterized protein n=1 Tax=Fusarium solani subsp. cucurbitae TaxID=2747967 RepID=A0ACD3YQ54_FUSSC|nr:hypothetical protein LCI18_002042 [Fusarium solani-melongenae]
MSQPYDGREMDAPLSVSGSVKRARERAKAGLPRHQPLPVQPEAMDDGPPGDLRAPPRRPMAAQPAGQSRLPRAKPVPAMDCRNGQGAPAISRPTQVPQWPLTGPPMASMASMNQPDPEPYRPPPGRPLHAPQRPPRPSQVPSLLDQSQVQDPTPVFLTPESDEYHSSVPPSPSSRSSLGSVPDFPTPNQSMTAAPSRRSANLGPPPSSRRGASSFYSNASYVSPIPEESLNSRSHGSYASSAAMPESWPGSREVSPTFYEETDTDKSHHSEEDDFNEFNDESKLVRSASIGKRGKPSIVNTKSAILDSAHRPAPSPVQPFNSGTGYVDASTSSSNTLPMAKPSGQNAPNDVLSPDAILGAYAAASATNLAETRAPAPTPSPQPFNRLSAIRRPPRLDMDAVRSMEERGSITSLPDLIRRATRLANMMDRGKRPASRFEDLSDYLDEKAQVRGGDKENSGLSDMLAAFPPPAQAQTERGSWFRTTSWPLAPSRMGEAPSRSGLRDMTTPDGDQKRRRRCCGLPVWGFVLVMILLLGIIAAAVLVPLEFFVFKNLSNKDKPQTALAQCQESLTCRNGGTNVLSKGVCSCVCTNGFTGSDCSVGGSDGCTTADLGGDFNNVTIGKAIPRLLEDASANFSIPLNGTVILNSLNAGNLSCIAQNSLVTFDGSSTREGKGSSNASNESESEEKLELESESPDLAVRAEPTAITISEEAPTFLVVDESTPTVVPTTTGSASYPEQTLATESGSAASPTATFVVTEDVLDFARVAVLYVLQEEDSESAQEAQSAIGRFLARAHKDSGVATKTAESIKLGGNNTVDLLRFKIDLGSGAIGGNAKRDVEAPQARRSTLDRAHAHGSLRRGGPLRVRR